MICSSKNTDKIFKDLPNAFSIGDDILIIGNDVDGKDDDNVKMSNADILLKNFKA